MNSVQKVLKVFPTNRKVRDYLKNSNSISSAISMEQFFEKLFFMQDMAEVDVHLRSYYLKKAAKNLEIKKLGFKKNFLDFLLNSQFIFKFFSEISSELISLSAIKDGDFYAEFDEHIDILEALFINYEQELKGLNMYDGAFISLEHLTINNKYFKNFDYIELFLTGYITKREYALFKMLSCSTDLILHIKFDKYNKRLLKRFQEEFGALKEGHFYKLSLKNSTVLEEKKIQRDLNIKLYQLSSEISQIGFIFHQIEEHIEKNGIDPSKIALILPDEGSAKKIKVFDKNRNINFAMGFALKDEMEYKSAEVLYGYLKSKNIRETLRAKEFFDEKFLKEISLDKSSDLKDVFEFFISLFKEHKDVVKNELFWVFEHEDELNTLSYLDIFKFLLESTKDTKIDDTQGGKITALGVLESRLMEYDLAIVVDFNDGVVPKVTQKELFLNSAIKKRAGIPTINDREALQKQYYLDLFEKCKKVAICYIEKESKSVSKIAYELNLSSRKIDEALLRSYLFKESKKLYSNSKKVVLKVDLLKDGISASFLKEFLSCKRRFYYKKIKNIKEPKLMYGIKSYEFGTMFHEILKDVYMNKKAYFDKDELKSDIQKNMQERLFGLNSRYLEFESYLFMDKIEPFLQNEIDRFKSGYEVFLVESDFEENLCGTTFKGRIDRIDIKDNRLEAIDYKFRKNLSTKLESNIEKAKDFQLAIYLEALRKKYKDFNIDGAYFYDMYEGKLLSEKILDEKIEYLPKVLEELGQKEIDFCKQGSLYECRQCTYKDICIR